jgi:alpha-D-ribose 1-methylphosphonate 5-triphosphate synthase subunit PhnI
MQVDRNKMQVMAVLLDSGIERGTGLASGERERRNLSLAIMDRNGDAMSNSELARLFQKPPLLFG